MGHLMCAGCFTHLLADSRLRDQVATCPNCRVEISKNNATRNLAVEKAVSELPSECQVSQKVNNHRTDGNNNNDEKVDLHIGQLTKFYISSLCVAELNFYDD